MGEHIQVKVIGFDENQEECIAIMNGLEVRIDPFVTDIWDWKQRNELRGEWWFSGHWDDYKCFLPYRCTRIA
ncbi:hypothetical protein DFQ01_11076 [Paenibacillus cellulosilyticus]|uniref:Uncharacterized protein n=1 Tax=Paenibacillus cellulosilyticus TaxID=375489 RepID=A0A2V2YTM4_9BACL|nr:hypothetical protein [Paenibacillus cellulosilyticus]PWW01186.1 hypothetical protein DFQ01_11076 [Paenibacillus cellulosilyticus]QKS46856.1 hypothetical protein HUB94_20445 [Paenibacillus cellulosilyticus]